MDARRFFCVFGTGIDVRKNTYTADMEILKETKTMQESMRMDRRYLHENAELGFQLPKTSAYVFNRLKSMGYTPKRLGRCALTAEIGVGERCFLLRADMDALPIKEQSGQPFSCAYGNMHACGHDLHTAILLAVAELLKRRETDLKGRVRLLFQPAEETLEGAKYCIKKGCLDGVSAAMMLHVLPLSAYPTGTVIVSSAGVSAPAADFFNLTFYGKSCHGSSPWQGVDAILLGAKSLLALETLSSREFSSSVPMSLTIGQFHAGEADNVLASKAVLSGTLRAMSEETRVAVKKRMGEIVTATAKSLRGRVKITYKSGCPCLENDESLSGLAYEVAQRTIGKERVCSSADFPKGGVGGSEDFAYISQAVPSIMVGLCAGEKGSSEPLHSPHIRFVESAMPYGVAVLSAVALAYCRDAGS